MTRSEEVVYIARKLGFIRETTGPNRGLWVEMLQRMCGGEPGFSWCAYFVCFVLAVVFGGYTKSPIVKTGRCQDIYEQAKKKGWVTDKPSVGDLFLYVDANDHAHHVGIVTEMLRTRPPYIVDGIAGNTSEDGKSNNGTGVFEHAVSSTSVFIHYPRGE